LKPGTDKLLARAARSLGAATEALENGAADKAAGRAYSAMISAAKALLNENGLRLTTHARICTAFEKHALAARLPARQVARLREAQERRERIQQEGLGPSFDDVGEWVDGAAEFVAAVQSALYRA
jgi:uncharacterized protein (UPF0332 family)